VNGLCSREPVGKILKDNTRKGKRLVGSEGQKGGLYKHTTYSLSFMNLDVRPKGFVPRTEAGETLIEPAYYLR
jgi:hypothetical protein